MNSKLSGIASFVLAILIALPAFGASISYMPGTTEMETQAGSSGNVVIRVMVQGISGRDTYKTWVIDKVDGSISGWVNSSPSFVILDSTKPSVTAMLTVTVPADTPGGSYTGRLYSKSQGPGGEAAAGSGLLVEVNVPGGCQDVPEVQITSPLLNTYWPPDKHMENVVISGTITLPQGCTLLDSGFRVEDEYGDNDAEGELTVNGGIFTASVPIQLWRDGDDEDGRHYSISVFALDEYGEGTGGPVEVVIPHDMRGKKN